jgi:Intracellular proteinase inhibitor
MVERAVISAIVGAAILLALAAPRAGAEEVAITEQCNPGRNSVTSVPPRRGGAVELKVAPTSRLVSGRSVEWQFTVTNRGARPVNLVFGSSQFGDVILRPARKGAVDPVYRWSAGKAFAHVVSRAVLPAYSSWRCSLTGSTLAVAPGRYLLSAYLKTQLLSPTRTRAIVLLRYVDVVPAP